MNIGPRNTVTGVTLVELLVTIAVVAILLTLGVGGFRTLIANTKMTNAANSLIGHLHFARSEAVKRNLRVKVCPSADGQTCISASLSLWHPGYIVAVIDDAGNIVPPILRRVDPDEMQGVRIDSGGRRSFVYQGDGSAEGSEGTLKICDPGDPTRIRQVVVNRMGRTYVRCNEPSAYSCPATCP
jgi:type IV fimbrial biogenesis protein FimT